VRRVRDLLAKMASQLEITPLLWQNSSPGLFTPLQGKRKWVFFKFVGGEHCPEKAGCIGWIAKGRSPANDLVDYAAIVVENQEHGLERGKRAARFKPVAVYTPTREREEAAGTVRLSEEELMKQDAKLLAVQTLSDQDFGKHVKSTLNPSWMRWSEIMNDFEDTFMPGGRYVAKHVASIPFSNYSR